MKKFNYNLLVLIIIIFASKSYATTFKNPSFEDLGILSDWTYSGIVSQVSSATVLFTDYEYTITAKNGNSMALLSAPGLCGGGSYGYNLISQTIANFGGGTIYFDYNIFSVDWRGNDRFTVEIDAANDAYDYYLEIDELIGTPKPIEPFEFYYSDWQHFSHNLDNYTGSLTITLRCGNGVDDNWNTWTYLDNFSITSIPEPETGCLFFIIFILIGIPEFKRIFKKLIKI